MINLLQKTPSEIDSELAVRVAKIRKRRKLSQRELASRSGVSYGSIRRFEQTGEISLQSLTKIAIALEVEEELQSIFSNVPFRSLEEMMREQKYEEKIGKRRNNANS